MAVPDRLGRRPGPRTDHAGAHAACRGGGDSQVAVLEEAAQPGLEGRIGMDDGKALRMVVAHNSPLVSLQRFQSLLRF